MIRLRNLVESLETKYNLNEAFSEDMPDWFAKRLLTTKYTPTSYYRGRDLGGAAHYPMGKDSYISGKGAKKNPEFGQTPAYKAREPGWYDDQSLFTNLLDKGISLDTVKIIEGPIPTSENDKRLQPPNIPIFLFDNGVVYARGINDEEKLGTRKSLGAYSVNNLLAQCKKFAYIDGNDPDNFKVNDRKLARNSAHRYSTRRGKYFDRDGQDVSLSQYWNSNRDKSGYEVVSLPARYKDKLDEIKAGKIFDILKGYENYINNAYQELGNLISQTPIISYDNTNKPDYSPYNIYSSNDTIADKLQQCASAYTDIVMKVDNIINSNDTDDKKRRQIISLFNYEIDRLDTKINSLEKLTSRVFNSTIDWI